MRNKLGFLLLLTFFAACTQDDPNPVKAIVNGVEIRKSDAPNDQALNEKIEKTVLQTEAKRIHLNEQDLLSFFDLLKTRNIPKDQLDDFMKKEFKDQDLKKQSRDDILNLMREKQFAEAKKRYISELKDRSTIWVIQDGQKVKYQKPL